LSVTVARDWPALRTSSAMSWNASASSVIGSSQSCGTPGFAGLVRQRSMRELRNPGAYSSTGKPRPTTS
jgi:hypothetical protein